MRRVRRRKEFGRTKKKVYDLVRRRRPFIWTSLASRYRAHAETGGNTKVVISPCTRETRFGRGEQGVSKWLRFASRMLAHAREDPFCRGWAPRRVQCHRLTRLGFPLAPRETRSRASCRAHPATHGRAGAPPLEANAFTTASRRCVARVAVWDGYLQAPSISCELQRSESSPIPADMDGHALCVHTGIHPLAEAPEGCRVRAAGDAPCLTALPRPRGVIGSGPFAPLAKCLHPAPHIADCVQLLDGGPLASSWAWSH
jgi:hypothetical protein